MTTAILEADNTIALHAELTDIIREAEAMPEVRASRLAEAVIQGLKKRMAGESIYIASGLTMRERCARDKAIRAEYNGRNRVDVCQKYGVSKAHLFRIIARC